MLAYPIAAHTRRSRMAEPTPIDFSPLDPRRDPEGWERLVARVLRDSEPDETPPPPQPVPATDRPSTRVLPSS